MSRALCDGAVDDQQADLVLEPQLHPGDGALVAFHEETRARDSGKPGLHEMDRGTTQVDASERAHSPQSTGLPLTQV